MDRDHRTSALQISRRRWPILRQWKRWVLRATQAGLVAALVVIPTAAAAGRDPHSAAFHYPACRGLLAADEHAPHLQGSCVGQIALLLQLSDVLPQPLRFCAPSRMTVRQATEIVAAYMERHPGELHRAFPLVAILALRETWPCTGADEVAVRGSLQSNTDGLLHREGSSPHHGR
jgi:hypothetical protein